MRPGGLRWVAADHGVVVESQAGARVFDLSIWKILVLAVIGLLVFGPEQLPKLAGQAGRALRELRRLAEGAKSELQGSLGPEFENFDFADLNPKSFVRKHLFDDVNGANGDMSGSSNGAEVGVTSGMGAHGAGLIADTLPRGERPPYDAEAT
jgi:sec-independent protein translocase protein TatB